MLTDSLTNHMTALCIINASEPFKMFNSCKRSLRCSNTTLALTPSLVLSMPEKSHRRSDWVSESKTSPQTDWHVGYHIVTHQHWCFDKPAWPLCCTITWSQLVRSKVNANGWCSKGSSFKSGWESLYICVWLCCGFKAILS